MTGRVALKAAFANCLRLVAPPMEDGGTELQFTGGDASCTLTIHYAAVPNSITHQSHRKSFKPPEMKATVNNPCTTPSNVYNVTPK